MNDIKILKLTENNTIIGYDIKEISIKEFLKILNKYKFDNDFDIFYSDCDGNFYITLDDNKYCLKIDKLNRKNYELGIYTPFIKKLKEFIDFSIMQKKVKEGYQLNSNEKRKYINLIKEKNKTNIHKILKSIVLILLFLSILPITIYASLMFWNTENIIWLLICFLLSPLGGVIFIKRIINVYDIKVIIDSIKDIKKNKKNIKKI